MHDFFLIFFIFFSVQEIKWPLKFGLFQLWKWLFCFVLFCFLFCFVFFYLFCFCFCVCFLFCYVLFSPPKKKTSTKVLCIGSVVYIMLKKNSALSRQIKNKSPYIFGYIIFIYSRSIHYYFVLFCFVCFLFFVFKFSYIVKLFNFVVFW